MCLYCFPTENCLQAAGAQYVTQLKTLLHQCASSHPYFICWQVNVNLYSGEEEEEEERGKEQKTIWSCRGWFHPVRLKVVYCCLSDLLHICNSTPVLIFAVWSWPCVSAWPTWCWMDRLLLPQMYKLRPHRLRQIDVDSCIIKLILAKPLFIWSSYVCILRHCILFLSTIRHHGLNNNPLSCWHQKWGQSVDVIEIFGSKREVCYKCAYSVKSTVMTNSVVKKGVLQHKCNFLCSSLT